MKNKFGSIVLVSASTNAQVWANEEEGLKYIQPLQEVFQSEVVYPQEKGISG